LAKSGTFYKKGDIVSAPFPYQDDSEIEKYRPVLLLAPHSMKGWICSYITSKVNKEGAISISQNDMKDGRLECYPSFLLPSLLYTLNSELIDRKYGTLKDEKVEEVVNLLITILQQTSQSPPTSKALQRPSKPF
jgi:mRNA interferase MazF